MKAWLWGARSEAYMRGIKIADDVELAGIVGRGEQEKRRLGCIIRSSSVSRG